MTSRQMAEPFVRAIKIYRKVTRHDLDADVCRDLARHIKRLNQQGVNDPGRLTVHGLSYLRELDRQSRRAKARMADAKAD